MLQRTARIKGSHLGSRHHNAESKWIRSSLYELQPISLCDSHSASDFRARRWDSVHCQGRRTYDDTQFTLGRNVVIARWRNKKGEHAPRSCIVFLLLQQKQNVRAFEPISNVETTTTSTIFTTTRTQSESSQSIEANLVGGAPNWV